MDFVAVTCMFWKKWNIMFSVSFFVVLLVFITYVHIYHVRVTGVFNTCPFVQEREKYSLHITLILSLQKFFLVKL